MITFGSGNKYLYHGVYNNTYGVFYLSFANYANPDRTEFISYEYNSSKSSLNGIRLSTNYRIISQLINSAETSQYFDIIPESWMLYILNNVVATDASYNLCFIPKSDIEEFLNTYWKYEGGN